MNILNAIPAVSPSTRRSFLQKAASLAAAGAASGAAVTAALPPAPAEAAPIGGLEYFIASAFREIGDEIDDALEAWRVADEDCRMRDRAMGLWEKRYPMPPYLLPDDEDYNPTSRSDWLERKQNVMRRLQLGPRKENRNGLSDRYHDAVCRFALIEAHTTSELFFKAGFGLCVDSREGTIARSVLRDLYNFRTRLIPAPARA
ncbi:MAG: hypothetical protein AB7F72_01760 [Afipia sp.]